MNIAAPQVDASVAEAWVLDVQRKLHKWASSDGVKRFDDLFNLIHHPVTLCVAWARVRSNRGSRTAGVDAATRYTIEHHYGVERLLDELHHELKAGTFRPSPVRERAIPKASGRFRFLGIPVLRDRVVQMAMKLVLEPIFEADFYGSSYGYRPGRRAQDAVAEIVQFCNPPSSYEWVIEADVEACFDKLRHDAIVSEVARRVTDRKVLTLVRAFLRAGVMTQTGNLERRLTGTPQGGIISPLFANIALSVLDREFERRWKNMSRYAGNRQYLRRKGLPTYRLIRFADDFVVAVKGTQEQSEVIMHEIAAILAPLGLTLSPSKTTLTHIDDGFCFLGFRIQRRSRSGKGPAVYTFVATDRAKPATHDRVKPGHLRGWWNGATCCLEQSTAALFEHVAAFSTQMRETHAAVTR